MTRSRAKGVEGLLGTPEGARVVLLVTTLALVLLGVVMVYSAGSIEALSEGANPSSYLVRHAGYALIGGLLGLVAWRMPSAVWRGRLLWVVYLGSMALLVLTALVGTVGLGAQRWLSIGPVSLQPSEFAKIALLLMAVHLFALLREDRLEGRDFIVGILVLVVVPLGVLFKTQSDLGTTAIICVGILAVMWVGDVPTRVIALVVAGLAVFAVFAIVGTGYRADRFAYLDPWNDGAGGYGDGYQIIRSYFSIADGGVFGVGLGNSRGKYAYLPEAETDFIFAVIAEELGMVGGLAVIALFVVLLLAGLAVARQSADSYGAMLAGGLSVMIAFQAFLNIGCVVGLLPTTGKPLPFISSGGSSLIASLIMVGLILSVSAGSGVADVYERRRSDLRVVRATRT